MYNFSRKISVPSLVRIRHDRSLHIHKINYLKACSTLSASFQKYIASNSPNPQQLRRKKTGKSASVKLHGVLPKQRLVSAQLRPAFHRPGQYHAEPIDKRIQLAKWSVDDIGTGLSARKEVCQPDDSVSDKLEIEEPKRIASKHASSSKKKLEKISIDKLYEQLKKLSKPNLSPVFVKSRKSLMNAVSLGSRQRSLLAMKMMKASKKQNTETKSTKKRNLKVVADSMSQCPSTGTVRAGNRGISSSFRPTSVPIDFLQSETQLEEEIKKRRGYDMSNDARSARSAKSAKSVPQLKNKESNFAVQLQTEERPRRNARKAQNDNFSVSWPNKQTFSDNYSYLSRSRSKSEKAKSKLLSKSRKKIKEEGFATSKVKETQSDEDDEELDFLVSGRIYKPIVHPSYSLSNSLTKWSILPNQYRPPVSTSSSGKKEKQEQKNEIKQKRIEKLAEIFSPELDAPFIGKRNKITTTSSLKRDKNRGHFLSSRNSNPSKSVLNWSTELVLPTNHLISEDNESYQSSYRLSPFKEEEEESYSERSPKKRKTSRPSHAQKWTNTDSCNDPYAFDRKPKKQVKNVASFVLRKKQEEQMLARQRKEQESALMNKSRKRSEKDDYLYKPYR